jgi:deferrochelatase/peroxidase EfeB
MSMAPRLDPAQIQRLVVHACRLHRSRHFVLEVTDAAKARCFVGSLLAGDLVTPAAVESDEALVENRRFPLAVGFTYRGLERLQLDKAYLRVFQEKASAFAEGASRRGRRLADTGPSAPKWWEARFGHERAHVLLSVHGDKHDELVAATQTLEALRGADGLDGWKEPLDAAHLDDKRDYRKVHFGLRDLISDPGIEGIHHDRKKRHEPGEFLLGYKNDHKFNPWLLLNASAAPNPWLRPHSSIDPRFFWNGSFAALRKMDQDEQEFKEFVFKSAEKLNVKEAYIRAKLVGRWDDGRVVEPRQEEPPAGLPPADLDDFDFKKDPHGEGCPFGSHIRRLNPREDGVVPKRKRPLIRRGMPYGPVFNEKSAQEKRGLLGLFFCASLEDQFEHLLAEWSDASPMGPPNRGNARDPLLGGHGDPDAVFDIPLAEEKRLPLRSFKPFVTTRGTLYAFFPSMAGLEMIAAARFGGP